MPKLKQKPKVNTMALLVACLIVALTGTYLVFNSFAASCSLGNNSGCPTVKKGSKGSAVTILQKELNKVCADGNLKVDGAFGSQTEKLVKGYQHRQGLTIDGVVGSKTWKDLEVHYYHGKPAWDDQYDCYY